MQPRYVHYSPYPTVSQAFVDATQQYANSYGFSQDPNPKQDSFLQLQQLSHEYAGSQQIREELIDPRLLSQGNPAPEQLAQFAFLPQEVASLQSPPQQFSPSPTLPQGLDLLEAYPQHPTQFGTPSQESSPWEDYPLQADHLNGHPTQDLQPQLPPQTDFIIRQLQQDHTPMHSDPEDLQLHGQSTPHFQTQSPSQRNFVPQPPQRENLALHLDLDDLQPPVDQGDSAQAFDQEESVSDVVMPPSSPALPDAEDGSDSPRSTLTPKEHKANHNNCERLRRTVIRNITHVDIAGLIPTYDAAVGGLSNAYLWEEYRKYALELIDKRKRLIAQWEAKGVDVEAKFGITVSLLFPANPFPFQTQFGAVRS
ncbi:MAG: hypothetical protein L6R39_000444 [Caloplaca ligustica]|nr:MAG: hypothetical protein L6R39_000444 [Caloplaca ligustica]